MLSVYQCGKCGSPAIDTSELADTAKCRACGWSGKMNDLIVAVDNSANAPNNDQIAHRFFLSLRDLIANNCAVPIGRWLIQHGFCEVEDRVALTRYLKAATAAMAMAVVKEREQIEKEKAHARS